MYKEKHNYHTVIMKLNLNNQSLIETALLNSTRAIKWRIQTKAVTLVNYQMLMQRVKHIAIPILIISNLKDLKITPE